MLNGSRRSLLCLCTSWSVLAALGVPASAQERGRGVLLLAHGAHAADHSQGHAGHGAQNGDTGNPWNANVRK